MRLRLSPWIVLLEAVVAQGIVVRPAPIIVWHEFQQESRQERTEQYEYVYNITITITLLVTQAYSWAAGLWYINLLALCAIL